MAGQVFELEGYSKFILAALNEQRKEGRGCDVDMVSCDGKHFPAHSPILSAVSPFLHTRLAGLTDQHLQPKSLVIHELQSDMMQVFLNVIYTGQLLTSGDKWPDSVKLYKLVAETLDLRPVLEICNEALQAACKIVFPPSNQLENRSEPVSSTMLHVSHIKEEQNSSVDSHLDEQDLPMSNCEENMVSQIVRKKGQLHVKHEGEMPATTEFYDKLKELTKIGINVVAEYKHNLSGDRNNENGSVNDKDRQNVDNENGSSRRRTSNAQLGLCAQYSVELSEAEVSTPDSDKNDVDFYPTKLKKQRKKRKLQTRKAKSKMTSYEEETGESYVKLGDMVTRRRNCREVPKEIAACKMKSSEEDTEEYDSEQVAKESPDTKRKARKVPQKIGKSKLRNFEEETEEYDSEEQEEVKTKSRKRKRGRPANKFKKQKGFHDCSSVYRFERNSKPDKSEVLQTFSQVTSKLLVFKREQKVCDNYNTNGEEINRKGACMDNIIVEEGRAEPIEVHNTFINIMKQIKTLRENQQKDDNESDSNSLGRDNQDNITKEEMVSWKKCKYCSQFKGRKKGRLEFHRKYCHSSHKCHLCQKPFVTKCDLGRHRCKKMDVFMCDICGQVLRDRPALNLHLKIHTGEKNKICSFCGKTFLRSYNLKAHVAHTHQTERPYLCNQCGSAYAFKYELNRHMQKHGEARFVCDTCGTSFCERFKWIKHVKRAHSGNTKANREVQSSEYHNKLNFAPNIAAIHRVDTMDNEALLGTEIHKSPPDSSTLHMASVQDVHVVPAVGSMQTVSQGSSSSISGEHWQSLAPQTGSDNNAMFQPVAYVSTDLHLMSYQGISR